MSWKTDVLLNNLVPSSFYLRKKPAKNTIFSNFFIGWKPQGTQLKVADCQTATLLKMNFFIGIFQGFWLQITEHVFSRTPFKWLLLQRCIQDLVKHLRWGFFVNISNSLKPLTIFTKKLHLRCFTKLCVRFCYEVTSSICQTYKFKDYCNSFWRHCNVFDVVFARINETLCPLSDVTLSKNLELLCDFMFATNTKTIIYIT